VAAASFAIPFVNAGARSMIGVSQKPIIAEFGWSRGEFSAVVFVNTVMLALSIAIAGLLCDRFESTWVLLASSALFFGGLMLSALMSGLWQFFPFCGVAARGGADLHAAHQRETGRSPGASARRGVPPCRLTRKARAPARLGPGVTFALRGMQGTTTRMHW
jgi:MFS family permease